MRAIIVILFSLFCTTSLVCADEQFAVLNVGGDVYSNVTVTSVTATDLYFTHANGIGNVKLKDLDAALQKHFHYDAAAASAVEQQLKAGNALYLSQPVMAPASADPAQLQATLDATMDQVRAIVNQPVAQLTATPDMDVSIYQPGWFHPGAITPDFNNVDIRPTQDLNYGNHQYVSSDINPGICFRGSDVEFNSMTKFFYTDRSLPKKKLTEDEMQEINRLYRVIGDCQEKLAHPQKPQVAASPAPAPNAATPSISTPPPAQAAASGSTPAPDPGAESNPNRGFLSTHITILVSAAAGLILVLMVILNSLKGRAEA
jgi:hypothetical protein